MKRWREISEAAIQAEIVPVIVPNIHVKERRPNPELATGGSAGSITGMA